MKMFKRNSQCAFLVKFFLRDFGNELNCECFVFCALILGETTPFGSWQQCFVFLLNGIVSFKLGVFIVRYGVVQF